MGEKAKKVLTWIKEQRDKKAQQQPPEDDNEVHISYRSSYQYPLFERVRDAEPSDCEMCLPEEQYSDTRGALQAKLAKLTPKDCKKITELAVRRLADRALTGKDA